MRRYEEQWQVRLSQKDPSKSVKEALQSLEDQLDVFNLTLARQRAAAEVRKKCSSEGKDLYDCICKRFQRMQCVVLGQ